MIRNQQATKVAICIRFMVGWQFVLQKLATFCVFHIQWAHMKIHMLNHIPMLRLWMHGVKFIRRPTYVISCHIPSIICRHLCTSKITHAWSSMKLNDHIMCSYHTYNIKNSWSRYHIIFHGWLYLWLWVHELVFPIKPTTFNNSIMLLSVAQMDEQHVMKCWLHVVPLHPCPSMIAKLVRNVYIYIYEENFFQSMVINLCKFF